MKPQINSSARFKYQCCIAINNSELVNELREYGYYISPLIDSNYRKGGILCNGKVAIGVPIDTEEFTLSSYLEANTHIINCLNNIGLFLAIAAIQNNTDKHQWFTNNSNTIWLKSSDRNFIAEKSNYHKATIEELFNFFNL